METHPAKNMATHKFNFFKAWNTPNPVNPAITPIFSILAPKAVIPPSPKKNACTVSTTAKTRTAAQDYQIRWPPVPPPNICPLVPQGIGIFMACIANINAAKTAINGHVFSSRFFLAHLRAKINCYYSNNIIYCCLP